MRFWKRGGKYFCQFVPPVAAVLMVNLVVVSARGCNVGDIGLQVAHG